MFTRFVLPIILIFTLFAQLPVAEARGDFVPCNYPDGEFYQANAMPVYDGANQRLALKDWNTGEVIRVLAEGLPHPYFVRSWSPNCRYIVAITTQHDGICPDGLLLMDVTTGDLRQHLDGFCDHSYGSYGRVFWKPDSSVAVLTAWYRFVGPGSSTYPQLLWHSATNQLITIQPYSQDYINRNLPDMAQVYWDDSRGWVWMSGGGGILAFDINTGIQQASFENYPFNRQLYREHITTVSYFTFSPDGTKVVAHGQRYTLGDEAPAMTVYDIASGQGTQVNVERNGVGAVALSADNRYLVMGYDALRVWDLHNLPEQPEDRLPVYRHGGPGSFIRTVRFIEATVVEVTTERGITRWDILTGANIPT